MRTLNFKFDDIENEEEEEEGSQTTISGKAFFEVIQITLDLI